MIRIQSKGLMKIRIFGMLFFTSILFAQGSEKAPTTDIGSKWISVPPSKDAPPFRFQIGHPSNQALPYNILLQPGTDTNAWALQVSFADPRVVKMRKSMLKGSKATLKEYELILKVAGHQDEGCQQRILEFMESTREAQINIRDYDPFNQSTLYFEDRLPFPDLSLGQGVLEKRKATNGQAYFTGDIYIQKDLDVAQLDIPALVTNFSLVPLEYPHRRPVLESQLTTIRLHPAWHIRDQLRQDPKIVEALWNRQGGIYLKSLEGYLPGDPGEVRGLACYGAEGHFSAPDLWSPHPDFQELHFSSEIQAQFHIWVQGSVFYLQGKSYKKPIRMDLQKHISGQAEGGWQILDAQITSRGFFLLFEVTSLSRPDSPSSYCGAGEETDLIWLWLGQEGETKGVKSELTDSCFQSLSNLASNHHSALLPQFLWAIQRPSGSAEFEDGPVRVIRYDIAHPDRGLIVKEMPEEAWRKYKGGF